MRIQIFDGKIVYLAEEVVPHKSDDELAQPRRIERLKEGKDDIAKVYTASSV